VRAARGKSRIQAVTIRRGGQDVTLDCDRLACGYGLVPEVTLAHALGCEIQEGAVVVDDRQHTSVDNVLAAGECIGIGGVEVARVEGTIARLVAINADVPSTLDARRAAWRRFAARTDAAFSLQAAALVAPGADTLVCRCEDVMLGDVMPHRASRDAKLHTRCAMGACQARICGTALSMTRAGNPSDHVLHSARHSSAHSLPPTTMHRRPATLQCLWIGPALRAYNRSDQTNAGHSNCE
jgi:D-hydroxyproline dehydrogenase subunit alpha